MSVQFSSVTSLCIPTRLYDCEAVSSASGQVAIEWFVLGWVTVCMWSLWTGKPSQYITNIKANLAFHSSGGWQIEYRPIWLGFRRGAFTYVGLQVTLRDPIRQVTLRLRSSEISYAYNINSWTHAPLTFKLSLAFCIFTFTCVLNCFNVVI